MILLSPLCMVLVLKIAADQLVFEENPSLNPSAAIFLVNLGVVIDLDVIARKSLIRCDQARFCDQSLILYGAHFRCSVRLRRRRHSAFGELQKFSARKKAIPAFAKLSIS